MSNQIISLNNGENFTLLSNIAQRLNEEGWNKIWKPLMGRPKSTVFVFDKVNNRLLYELSPNERVQIISRILDPLQGIQYQAFAVSNQSKTFRFQTEFIFGDTKIPHTSLEIRLRAVKMDDIAIAVAEGDDPVKELCSVIKADLDVAFKEVYLENIDSLQIFTERIISIVKNLKVEHPYIKLENATIQIELPKSIEEAFENIQTERIKHKTSVETKDHEIIEVEKKHRVDKLKREAELELDEIELSRLGITDSRIRLLMRDPEKRTKYLDQIYQQQMELIKKSTEQDEVMLKIQIDTIEKFRDKALDESSDVEDLKQLLDLINQTTGTPTTRSILTSVTTDDIRSTPRLEAKSKGSGEFSIPEGETPPIFDDNTEKPKRENDNEPVADNTPSPPKRQRRRRRASEDKIDETDE